MLEFVEFYAELGGMDRDTLLTRILTERLKEVKEQFKGIALHEYPGDVLSLKDFPFSERLYMESDRGLNISQGILISASLPHHNTV